MTRFARLLTMALLLAGCDSRAGALSEHDSPADAALDAALQTAFAAALREARTCETRNTSSDPRLR